MAQIKVTVSIPTRNSGKTLDLCLKALKKQIYKNIEINIIDSASTDETHDIAKKYKVEFVTFRGPLLSARYEGVKRAHGKYVLILDSDQILSNDTIEKCVSLCEKGLADMVALEESIYKKETFIEKLFELDRKLIERVKDFSPYTGVIMPRFYKTSLLKKAFKNIPEKILTQLGGTDHVVIYYEAWKQSQRVDEVPEAVKHIEPDSLGVMWKKFYRWGYTSVAAKSYGKYKNLMVKKERLRTGVFSKGLFIESVGSIILVGIKYVPFKIGRTVARIRGKLERY